MGKAGLWLQPRTSTNSWLLLCLTGNEIRVKEETGNNNTEQKQRTVLNESVVIVSFFPVRRDAPRSAQPRALRTRRRLCWCDVVHPTQADHDAMRCDTWPSARPQWSLWLFRLFSLAEGIRGKHFVNIFTFVRYRIWWVCLSLRSVILRAIYGILHNWMSKNSHKSLPKRGNKATKWTKRSEKKSTWLTSKLSSVLSAFYFGSLGSLSGSGCCPAWSCSRSWPRCSWKWSARQRVPPQRTGSADALRNRPLGSSSTAFCYFCCVALRNQCYFLAKLKSTRTW